MTILPIRVEPVLNDRVGGFELIFLFFDCEHVARWTELRRLTQNASGNLARSMMEQEVMTVPTSLKSPPNCEHVSPLVGDTPSTRRVILWNFRMKGPRLFRIGLSTFRPAPP